MYAYMYSPAQECSGFIIKMIDGMSLARKETRCHHPPGLSTQSYCAAPYFVNTDTGHSAFTALSFFLNQLFPPRALFVSLMRVTKTLNIARTLYEISIPPFTISLSFLIDTTVVIYE